MQEKISLKDLESRAQADDPDSQVSLALCYEIGLDCTANIEAAAYWWRKAAEHGHGWACYCLSGILRKGLVKGSCADEADQWLLRAKELGFSQPASRKDNTPQ